MYYIVTIHISTTLVVVDFLKPPGEYATGKALSRK